MFLLRHFGKRYLTVLSVSCHSVRPFILPVCSLITAISFHNRLFCFLVHMCFIVPVFKHLKSFPWESDIFVLYVAHVIKRKSSDVDTAHNELPRRSQLTTHVLLTVEPFQSQIFQEQMILYGQWYLPCI